MTSEQDSPDSGSISTRTLVILFLLSLGAAIFFLQALFGFPLADVFRAEVKENVKVILKQDGICVLDTSDHPRSIPNCQYNIGDNLTVYYREGTAPIERYSLLAH